MRCLRSRELLEITTGERVIFPVLMGFSGRIHAADLPLNVPLVEWNVMVRQHQQPASNLR